MSMNDMQKEMKHSHKQPAPKIPNFLFLQRKFLASRGAQATRMCSASLTSDHVEDAQLYFFAHCLSSPSSKPEKRIFLGWQLVPDYPEIRHPAEAGWIILRACQPVSADYEGHLGAFFRWRSSIFFGWSLERTISSLCNQIAKCKLEKNTLEDWDMFMLESKACE